MNGRPDSAGGCREPLQLRRVQSGIYIEGESSWHAVVAHGESRGEVLRVNFTISPRGEV